MEHQRSGDDHTPKFLTGVEIVGVAASIATILDYFTKVSSSLSDHDSEKSKSRRTTLHLLQHRLVNMGKAYGNSDSFATSEVPDAVRTRLKELEQIASNLQKRFSSGVIKAIKCRVVQGSFDTQVELLRKGLEDIEGALKPYGSSSGYASANALMSHPSNGQMMHVQASTSTPTPHVQNNFYIKNVTVNNGQASEYKYPGTLHAATHDQIAQPLKYSSAPGIPYLAPQSPIGYPRY